MYFSDKPIIFRIMLDESKKRKIGLYPVFSLATIIIGATILTLPWVIGRAGLVLGLFIVLFSGSLSAYSGVLILKNGYGYFDFSTRCREVLGSWSVILAHLSSIVCLSIALTAFHIFLAENLYDIVNFFIDEAHAPRLKWWSIQTSGGIYALVLFCLVLIPKPTLLIKISSFAFLFVIAVSIIIIITGFSPKEGINMSTVKYVDTGFSSSIGVLSVCCFCKLCIY
jgi:amino acid permease